MTFNKWIRQFAVNRYEEFTLRQGPREEQFVQEGVTLAITNKMMVGRMRKRYFEKVKLSRKVVKEIGPLGVGASDIEITSEIDRNIWVSIISFFNSVREF